MKMTAKNNEYTEFKNAVKAGGLKNLYVFYGAETYLRDFYIGELKRKLLTPGMEEFNLHRFEGKGLREEELAGAIDSLPVGADKKLVIIRDLDIYKLDAGFKSFLEGLFSDMPEYCVLVFIYDALEYKSDARQKIHASIKKYGAFVEFKEQGRHDLVAWVKRRFAALDKTIETDTAEYLLFLCGNYMNYLVGETEKIGAYAKGKRIEKSDIDAVAAPQLDAVVFSLTDAISVRDADKALKILKDLFLQREEPIVILGAIGSQIRRLYAAKLAMAAGRGTTYVMELCGLKSAYPAELSMRAAGKVSIEWCRKAVKLCAEADIKLKSSAADKETGLEMLVLNLLQDGVCKRENK